MKFFLVAVYKLFPKWVAYAVYTALFKISPRLIPEEVRPEPIEPGSIRDFMVDSMKHFRSDPKFAGVYATLDDKPFDLDDIPKTNDVDLGRVIWHNLAIKPRNRAERRRMNRGGRHNGGAKLS